MKLGLGESQTEASNFTTLERSNKQGFELAWPVLTIFSLFLLFGLSGNVVAIYVICSRSKLRTVTNFLLLNLAIADVLFLFIGGTFTIVNYVYKEWPLGNAACRLTHFLMYTTCYVSVYTLVIVTSVRYSIVVNGSPLKCTQTQCRVTALIISLWIFFVLAKFPVLLIHNMRKQNITGRIECIIDRPTEAGRRFFTTFFIFSYFLPLSIIATLNIRIVRYLYKRKRNSTYLGQVQEKTRHVTKTVFIVVVVFAFAWLPLHVHLLITYWHDENIPKVKYYRIILVIFHCFCFLSSVLNPIIYNCCSEDFRSAFKEVVCSFRRSANNGLVQKSSIRLSHCNQNKHSLPA